jgi:V/A-type H+/Na+-transporting ATPase subunit G/H
LAHEKTATVSHSAVDSIIGALSQLEADIDGMNARVDEMKRRMMARSNEQVEKLKQQITAVANEEAKKIVDGARAEAEAESAQITKDAEKNLASIKKNIDSSFDKAVDSIVKAVLGQEVAVEAPAKAEPKKEKSVSAARIKKYSSEGKPLN